MCLFICLLIYLFTESFVYEDIYIYAQLVRYATYMLVCLRAVRREVGGRRRRRRSFPSPSPWPFLLLLLLLLHEVSDVMWSCPHGLEIQCSAPLHRSGIVFQPVGNWFSSPNLQKTLLIRP